MIENYIIKSSSFYIFGAGNTAIKVKNVIQSQGKIVSSFIVSSKPPKQQIDGIQAIAISDSSRFDTSLPIIIAIFNREPNAFLLDIIGMLKSLGFHKIITYPEFHSIYYKQLGDIFWLTDKNYYSQKIIHYNNILNLFEDQLSIENYEMIIDYLTSFDASVLKKPDFVNQYFPKDIDVWNGKDAFYDLGSYDGSNIIDAFKEKGILELVVAFEPDLDNFQKIVNNPILHDCAKQLFFYPCGVWSETTFLKFDVGSGESSKYNEFGTHIIPVVKVDDVLHSKPGYIKFDVEGAEIDALLGVKNTICKYKPSLAISIYHHPDHFYSIPALIKDWDLGYKFYVRLHGNNLFDTVLYCIH